MNEWMNEWVTYSDMDLLKAVSIISDIVSGDKVGGIWPWDPGAVVPKFLDTLSIPGWEEGSPNETKSLGRGGL